MGTGSCELIDEKPDFCVVKIHVFVNVGWTEEFAL